MVANFKVLKIKFLSIKKKKKNADDVKCCPGGGGTGTLTAV